MLFLIYRITIKKTIELVYVKRANMETIGAIEAPVEKLEELIYYSKEIDNIIGSDVNTEINIQELILECLNNDLISNKIKIREFKAPKHIQGDNFEIQINHFILEGAFVDLLRIIYLFETKYKIGRLISVEFKISFDRTTKNNYLLSEIYLQNINIKE